MNKDFTEEIWQEESKSFPAFIYYQINGLMSVFGNELPCPDCGKIGFYAPRKVSQYHYRMCKFCGFWQKVGDQSNRCNMFYHDCKNVQGFDPQLGYDWYLDITEYKCKRCNEKVSNIVKWPIKDTKHPYNNLLVYTCINPQKGSNIVP